MKHLGLFEQDNRQQGQAAAAAAEASSRDLARAVLGILRDAHVGTEPAAEPEDEPDTNERPAGASTRVSAGARVGAAAAVGSIPTSPPAPSSKAAAATLRPGEREVLDNGAEIHFVASLAKFAVYSAQGELHGYRRELADARTLAAKIKPRREETV